jgi:hypothetical protein
MTRAQALARLLGLGLTRKDATALLATAKRDGSASRGGVRAGCHPVSGRYYVARY